MLLLVTDTSGRQGSVALARASDGSNNEIHVLETASLSGGAFSAQLVPQIAALLTSHNLHKEDIDAFIVISGPGSFTGLRVGLAAIKALAEILAKPIVPVSLLEVVAIASKSSGNVMALLDAGRGEMYAGEYELAGGSAHLLQERLLRKDDIASVKSGSTVVTPDPALADAARTAGLSVSLVEQVSAAMIASLGCEKLRAGETVSPDHLEANYGRRSDAEIFSKPSSQ